MCRVDCGYEVNDQDMLPSKSSVKSVFVTLFVGVAEPFQGFPVFVFTGGCLLRICSLVEA